MEREGVLPPRKGHCFDRIGMVVCASRYTNSLYGKFGRVDYER
mgnify:CR=1 FL=1